MEERRGSPRLRTSKGGSIIFGLAPPIDCIVRNLSDTGAGLDIDFVAAVPDRFQLLIKPELTKRHCPVIWRAQGTIGVKFV
jgi:hypothetical protein